MRLVSELKRRNVFRVAIAYLIIAWLVLQVGDTLAPALHLGEWVNTALAFFLILGFPLALLFAWAFELTPEGLKKEKDVDRSQSITHMTGRKSDYLIISVLVLALSYFAIDRFALDSSPDIVPEIASKSIAVLPFADMSPEGDQEYFADGLSDTLIHVLAQVSGLKVTAKTSSFYFKGKNIDVADIARELNVGTILEGSVQRSGDRIRVIAKLIDAGHGTHLWSKSFDRDLKDIFAVQDEIAQEVVKVLKVTLLDTEEDRLAQRYQPTLEAYEQLILGRHKKAKRTADSLDAAEQHFQQAIELDPDYALPYVHLADTYMLQVTWSGLVFAESLKRQEPLIEKALHLDPFSGEAYAISATFRFYRQIKTGEADHRVEEEYLKALELSPNYARAYDLYNYFLEGQSRFEDALVQIRLAAELDPMSPTIQMHVSRATWNIGRVEEALAMIRRNIERNPEFPDNYDVMAIYQTKLGRLGEAQRWEQEALRRNPEDAYAWIRECAYFLNLGDVLAAEDCARELRDAHPRKIISLGVPLFLQWYRGKWDDAIVTLEALRKRVPGWSPYDRWLADLFAGQGDVERARQLMADAFPELLGDELELVTGDRKPALILAAIFHANGDIQRRDVLLVAIEELIATMHRTRGISYGILDIYIHTMRGDRDLAIAALREAIDMGWRVTGSNPLDGSWWMLRQDWKLASLHEDPEFIAMVDELEADVRKQRQWYEEHKDEPLF